MGPKLKPLALVLPCYNEAKSLRTLVKRTLDSAAKRSLTPADFRLILVDNGSTDTTSQVLAEMRNEPGAEFWRDVKVPVNRGYGHGVYTGLRAAGNDGGILAWSHADEQCDPEDVFLAWEMIRDKGPRLLVKGKRRGRSLGQWLFSRCFEVAALLILQRRIHEINAQPKVFDAGLLDALVAPPNGFAFDLYVLLKAAEQHYRLSEIPVLFPPRRHGESRWAATFRSKYRTIKGFFAFMIRYRLGKA